MKELELEVGKEIPYPFYVSAEVLKRKPACGGITLRDKEEVFLLKPLTSEKEVQTELVSNEISNWEEGLKDKVKELEDKTKNIEEVKKELTDLKKEKEELRNKHEQFCVNISNILYPEVGGAMLAETDKELINHTKEIVKRLKMPLMIKKNWKSRKKNK